MISMNKEVIFWSVGALILGLIIGFFMFNSNTSKNQETTFELWDKISSPLYNFKNIEGIDGNFLTFWSKHKIERDIFRIDTIELNHVFTSLECEEKLLSKNHPIAQNSKGEPIYFCLIERASYNFADCWCYYALSD